MATIRVRKRGETSFREVQTDPNRRTKISTSGRDSRVVVSSKSGRGVTESGEVIIDPKPQTRTIQTTRRVQPTLDGGQSTTPELQRMGRFQTLASREDLERGARQSLLLERRDYEQAFQSSIEERGGRINLPDTAKEERIRRENLDRSFDSQLSGRTRQKDLAVQELRRRTQEFISDPSVSGFISAEAQKFNVARATLSRSELVGRGGLELEQRGIASVLEGVGRGEKTPAVVGRNILTSIVDAVPDTRIPLGITTLDLGFLRETPEVFGVSGQSGLSIRSEVESTTTQQGIREFTTGRNILKEDPITSIGVVAGDVALLAGTGAALTRGASVSRTSVSFGRSSIPIETFDTTTTITRQIRGTVTTQTTNPLFARTIVRGGQQFARGRVTTQPVVITSTSKTFADDVIRTDQVLRPDLQTSRTAELIETRIGTGTSARTTRAVRISEQRGEIISGVEFTPRTTEPFVSSLSVQETALPGGRSLFTTRTETITKSLERSRGVLRERELLSQTGDFSGGKGGRISIAEEEVINLPAFQREGVRVGRFNIRPLKESDISGVRASTSIPNPLVFEDTQAIGRTVFSTRGPSVTRTGGIIRPIPLPIRPVGLSDSLIGVRGGLLGRTLGFSRAGIGASIKELSFSGPSPIASVNVLPKVISSPLNVNASLNESIGFADSGSISATDTLSKGLSRTTGGRNFRTNAAFREPLPRLTIIPPVIIPSLGGGGGGGSKRGKTRFRSRTKTGRPPSLVGAFFDIGIETKPGQEYTGLEVRR